MVESNNLVLGDHQGWYVIEQQGRGLLAHNEGENGKPLKITGHFWLFPKPKEI